MAAFQQIIFDSLVISFFALGIVAVAVGIGLLVCSTAMFRLFATVNRSVSTRKATKPMSVQRDIKPVVQRYRLWFGITLIIGAAYSIYGLGANFNAELVAAALAATPAANMSYSPVTLFVDVARWTMLVSSVLALAVGFILCFAPHTLGAIEAHTNRWISTRKAAIGVEKEYLTVDKWVETFPRTAGGAITLGALIVVISSGVMLFT
jgi:hypothetical protein